jgi:regulator of protease activity HflC (stomatin/prohibitin superfamily)
VPIRLALLAILLVLGFSALATSCTTIDAGNVGVVKHFGAVQSSTLEEGIHFVRPYGFATVTSISTKMMSADADAKASSKDLQGVSTKVSVQYSINGNLAPRVLQRVGDEGVVTASILSPALQECVKAVTSQYTAEQLITKRGEVKANIEKELRAFVDRTLAQKDVKGALQIASVAITNFEFSPEFNEAIEAKVKAEQDALKAENEKRKRVTQAEASAAEVKLAAEATAFQIENESKARADAIKRESDALQANPNLVQLRIAEKWNGVLPTYAGGGAIPMLNIK